MKLEVEFMPESCWGESLRKRMKPYRWNQLRKQVLTEQGDKCAICGSMGRLHCHEVWEYDDVRHVQLLLGFRMICPMCHGVEHYGMTNLLAASGTVLLQDYVDHFCRVNGVEEGVFNTHLADARHLLAERAKHEWTTDLGQWEHLATLETARQRERKRNTDLDGALQLIGSTICSATRSPEGDLELWISGITHHPPTMVNGLPRLSPSLAYLKLKLLEFTDVGPQTLPAEIVRASVSLGDCEKPWVELPLAFTGTVEMRLGLEPGGDFLLRGTGIDLDHAI